VVWPVLGCMSARTRAAPGAECALLADEASAQCDCWLVCSLDGMAHSAGPISDRGSVGGLDGQRGGWMPHQRQAELVVSP